MAFEIEFYKTKDGKEPVVDFLDSLDDKMAAKLVGLMEVLEEKVQNSGCRILSIWMMAFLNCVASREVI